MRTFLITGGNTGLGFETAKRLLAMGHRVYITSRNQERGAQAAKELGCDYLLMDVTSESSVEAAVASFMTKEDHLDVLINNAGIPGGHIPVTEVDGALMEKVMQTNVIGMVRVIHAFLPLLKKAAQPVMVNVSSGMGSFGKVLNPEALESKPITPVYSASKAAVSMLTLQYAKGLPEMRINVVDPGPTNTGGNFNRGAQNPTEGTDAIVKMATIGPDGPTGTFSDRNGIIPW